MSAVNCILCGAAVESRDPVAYPYCRICHYVGSAAENIRAEQIARLRAALGDGVRVNVWHTGGGCFALAFGRGDDGQHVIATDGDAGLPDAPDGGWRSVWIFADDEDEGTELAYRDPEDGADALTDTALVEIVRAQLVAVDA